MSLFQFQFTPEIRSHQPWAKEEVHRRLGETRWPVDPWEQVASKANRITQEPESVMKRCINQTISKDSWLMQFVICSKRELVSKLKTMQECVSTLVSKHKRSSTAVLFVSLLFAFFAYPYLEIGEVDPSQLNSSASFPASQGKPQTSDLSLLYQDFQDLFSLKCIHGRWTTRRSTLPSKWYQRMLSTYPPTTMNTTGAITRRDMTCNVSRVKTENPIKI